MCKQITSEYEFVERYSPETAERKYRQNLRDKGPGIKIDHDHALADFLERRIAEDKYSPSAACALLGTCEEYTFSTTLCRATVYKYISKGFLGRLTNKDLPAIGARKRPYRHIRAARAPAGQSIERRPAHIDSREEVGHWEMDSVVGTQGTRKALLVLTERATRYEIVLPVPEPYHFQRCSRPGLAGAQIRGLQIRQGVQKYYRRQWQRVC
jgi:IS30 family transposase